MLPVFDHRIAPDERNRALVLHGGGLVLAAFLSLLCFRIFNPYAFQGPGFFGLSLDTRWLGNMQTAQVLISGTGDSPPNFQWLARTPYLYPLQNMVIWGMGAPFGIVAWISWAWAGWRLLRSKPRALQNALLVVWVLVYFGWLGRNWVTTMRYFLPIYPVLAVLAAWGLLSLWRYTRGHVWRRRIAFALVAFVTLFTLLWAGMFTNVYRHLLTRVQATYWVWEHVPSDFAMVVNAPDDPAPIINIDVPNNGLGTRHVYDVEHPASAHSFVAPVTGEVSAVYASYLDDPNNDPGEELLYLTISTDGVDHPLAEALFGRDLTHDDDLPSNGYTIPFDAPVTLQAGQTYTLNILLLNEGPVIGGNFTIPVATAPPSDTPLINIPITNNNYGGSQDDLVSRVTRFDEFNPGAVVSFTAPASGTITSIHAPHLGDPNHDSAPEVLRFTVRHSGDVNAIATAILNTDLPIDAQNIVGRSYDIPFTSPLVVQKGMKYDLQVELLSGGVVISGGSIFTWEGAWDDPVPTGVCALPQGVTLEDDPPSGLHMDRRDCDTWLDPWWGLVSGYTQDIVYEDEESKREHLLLTLDNSDYIAISSNRFYDPLARNPLRWPMTNFYYKELFAGEMGYDLAATFQESFELGPLKVSDQYLPNYTAPQWLNEFESEEAFSVYDHPVVFIFHKRSNYDAQHVHDLLYSIPLTRVTSNPLNYNCPNLYSGAIQYPPPCDTTIYGVAARSSDQAASAPTGLQFTDEMRAEQVDNGTWSERFDVNSIVNTNQVVGVIVWYLTIMVFGFAAFPLLFVLLPSFGDRGYGLAKFAGMFLTAWGTWYLSSVHVPVWSQAGVAGGLVLLAAFGLALTWRRRGELAAFLREHWKRLALIELITLIAFLAFIGVRLTNPDLWHPSYGGEKPMDFAYFNGVLRSTIFPPIDPWFSGGYINYYYFGYVIVGTPVLLLKMVPSFAYNLILPTLFALTGTAAFSVAFTLVNALRDRLTRHGDPPDESGGRGKRGRRLGNPYVAGIAALMLVVVLGNLDTVHVFLTGVARMGGYAQTNGMQDYLTEQYTQEHDAPPDDATTLMIMQEAQNPTLVQQIEYQVSDTTKMISSVLNGFAKMLGGQELSISAERWFWGPTRVITEIPNVGGFAINEMPIFTFVYGDMHAHMIAMPMQLAIMGLLLNEILLAGIDKRRRWITVLAVVVIGIYVGMLRATNTWDWITYMVLGGVGLVFAWWLWQTVRYPARSFFGRFTRWSLLDLTWYVGVFVVVSFVAVAPFTAWYASSYNSLRLWTDPKTPLWAYFDIHGLFLFLVVTLLLWDTARWFRSVTVRALRGLWIWLVIGALVVAALLIGALVAALVSYQVALVVVPLLLWTAVLLLRPGQSRMMQFVLLLTGLALGLTLGVEIFVLSGDIGRQNTVFKFYIQAWLLFSVVGGAAFAWLISAVDHWRGVVRGAWMFVLVVLIGVASLFPIMAIWGKAIFRFDTNAPLTLDGMDYMTYSTQHEGSNDVYAVDPSLLSFPLSEDYAMIRWLQDKVRGTPTIMEGLSEDTQYRWNARISIYTGLPAVLGWNFHQKQQRSVDPLPQIVDARQANVNAFYQTTSIGSAWDILRYYDVRYVIVGGLEHAYYRAEGLAKFEQMVDAGLLEVVFHEGNSTIYRVNQDAQMSIQG